MNKRLDQLVFDIEFMLISVVQGVALAALASSAIEPLTSMQYQYWPYIASGIVLVMLFWSQSIIHSVSFIGWPLNLFHNFLYFLAAFVEVVAFSQVTKPVGWYGANTAFFVVALVLYLVDLKIIKDRTKFLNPELACHALQEQRLGLLVLVPLGIAFNLIAIWQTRQNPHLHLAFGLIQLVVGLAVLTYSLNRFKDRAKLLAKA